MFKQLNFVDITNYKRSVAHSNNMFKDVRWEYCLGYAKKPINSKLVVFGLPGENVKYHQTYNISHTKSQNLKCFWYRLAFVFAHSVEATCSVENEDVVGAAPTGDAPTTSE